MALDSRYIPFYNIAQFIFDKEDAIPLTAGIVRFWEDEQRATPKEVFRLSGISPNYTYTSLGAELTLGPTGAFVDDSNMPIVIYAYPYDADGNIQRYYIEVFSEDEVPQFVVEAAPYVFTNELPPDSILNGDNELNNSQFVEVSFNSLASHVYTFTAAINEEVQLAPNWLLIASGTGTVTVERVALTELNTPTNPPYVIDIISSGISTLTLTQRLTNSPRLVANGYLSGYFIAASEDSLQHALQMEYNPSGGTLDDNVIIDETVSADGSYNVLQGNLQITGTINPDPATTGYVDIDIIIPIGAHLRLSSFQLVQVNTGVNIAYGQLSTPKQINTLFSSYKNSLQYMPKESLTPWWKFGLNPLQLFSLGNIASQCSYICDQTILYQPAASQVAVDVGNGNQNGVLTVEAQSGATDARFALISYLAPQSCQGNWGYWMSSLARANLSTTHSTSVRIKVRLIYRVTLPATLSAVNPIVSWATGSDPVFAAGWTAVAPLNDPAYVLSTTDADDAGNATYTPYPFDQMQLPVPAAVATNMFGLVFYTMDKLNSSAGTEDSIAIDSISLVRNQFAVDSPPIPFSQVLAACQLYYETTYNLGVASGTSTTVGLRTAVQDGSQIAADVSIKSSTFTTTFTPKHIAPTVVYFAPDGTSATLNLTVYKDGVVDSATNLTFATYWVQGYTGLRATSALGFGKIIATVATTDKATAYVAYHAVFNSLLGR